MKEVIQVTSHTKRLRADKDHLEPDQALEFSRLKSFTLIGSKAQLFLGAVHNGNGIEAIGWAVPSKDFDPDGQPIYERWEFTFGIDPNRRSSLEFGSPPALTAEFLGHPERDFWYPLIDRHDKLQQSEVIGFIPTENEIFQRYYIATSPIIEANFYGIDTPREDAADSKYGFAGKGMYVLEFGRFSDVSTFCDFKIGIVLIPNSDHKLRIYETDWQAPHLSLDEKETKKIISNLARVNLFFRGLETLENHPWLKTGVPLHLIDALRSYINGPHYNRDIEDFKEDWGNTIKEKYGIDLIRSLKEVSPTAKKIESERLRDAVNLILHGNQQPLK